MKLIYLTFIAVFTSIYSVGTPIEATSSELHIESNFGFYNSERGHVLPKIDIWSSNSRIYKLVNHFFGSKISDIENFDLESVTEKSDMVFYNKLEAIVFTEEMEVMEPVQINFFELLIAISEFNIYPNIPENEVTISLNYLSNIELQIHNSKGNLVSKVLCGGTEKVSIVLDISDYPEDAYFITDGTSTMRFDK